MTIHQFPSRPFRRRDGKVRSRVLALNVERDRALIEARWGPQGRYSNRLVVPLDHMARHYGLHLA